jgi:hypothetical protein
VLIAGNATVFRPWPFASFKLSLCDSRQVTKVVQLNQCQKVCKSGFPQKQNMTWCVSEFQAWKSDTDSPSGAKVRHCMLFDIIFRFKCRKMATRARHGFEMVLAKLKDFERKDYHTSRGEGGGVGILP